jgi:ubiquinone/menaquinone biosynthesis C-methylase UbiE
MSPDPIPRKAPDRAAALAQYRRRAPVYDLELAVFEPIRRRAIALLAPRPGDTVFDVGCGTGLSLPLLHQAVGAKGRIVGIEQSPDMIELARQRVREPGWRHVQLIQAPAETAPMTGVGDAALFHFTHDILRRPEALKHLVSHLRPGARVVASGVKWAPFWAWPANLLVLPAALRSVTTFEGLARPWSELENLLGPMQVQTLLFGAAFVALGTVPGR